MSSVISKISDPPIEGSDSPIPFFHLVERLKTEPREGWRRFRIGDGESIADHMYRMSIITMLAPPTISSKINIPRCTKMALIHDMAESLVGDITPKDEIAKQEKSRREAETMDYISKTLLGNVYGGNAGEDIRKVWQEYEDSETLESRFVHDVDKIELLLQMVEYEKSLNAETSLAEFVHVVKRVKLEEMRTWADEIIAERNAFWQSKSKEPPQPDISKKFEEQSDQYYGKSEES